MLHPAVRIYLWFCFAIAALMLNEFILIFLAGTVVLLSSVICPSRFFQVLRRTRWVLLTAFLVYAYTGTGAAIWPQLGRFSPLSAGVTDGFEQLLRLIVLLASLSLLLAFLNPSQLIAGLHSITYPLSFFSGLRERLVVRLALTIQYTESTLLKTNGGWFNNIEDGLQVKPVKSVSFQMTRIPLFARDWLVVFVASIMLGVCL